MNEITIDHMYFFIINLRKHFQRNLKVNFDINFFRQGKRDIKIISPLTSFMSYYRSSHFDFFDFQMYFLMKIIENEEFLNCTKLWMPSEVKNISLDDLETTLNKDREFLIAVAKKSKVTSLKKFFDINKNGESLISIYYKKDYVSIQFLAEYSTYFTETKTETQKHKTLVKAVKLIKKIRKNKNGNQKN